MIAETLKQIKSGENIKANLQILKEELKEVSNPDMLRLYSDEYKVFTLLLQHPDPKIRKHSAAILGLLNCDACLDELVNAYLAETTNYTKATYLSSIGVYDYSNYIPVLKERADVLLNSEFTDDNRKHICEELHELFTLLKSGYALHDFTGAELINEFVLLTNRNFKSVTAEALKGIPHKEFPAGIMVKSRKLDYIRKNIRTYSELLFIPGELRECSSEPVSAVKELIDSGLIKFVFDRLDNQDSPVFFRVEYRTKDIKLKSEFEKKLASELEYQSHWRLVNSTSDYELELRFIDNSAGRLVILLDFKMLHDERFSYRKEILPVSLKPSTAALLCTLAGEFFTDNAAVIDPFCGSSTLLIERDIAKPARILYGVDIVGDAVKVSRTNIKAAGLSDKTEIINKDFFAFHHDYKFDEVLTDMPIISGQKNRIVIEQLYEKFFKQIPHLLENNAKLFIYTHNRDFLRRYSLTVPSLKILKEYEISKVEGSYFFILSYNR